MNFYELVDFLEDDAASQRRPQQRKYLKEWQNPIECLTEEEFRDRYRLPKAGFLEFLNIIKERLLQGGRGQPIPPMHRFLTFLRFVSSGSFEIISGDLERVSQPSTSRIIAELSEIIASLRPQFVLWPTSNADVRQAKEDFQQIAGLPSMIGALDCTHVRIQSVGGDQAERFRNRKGYYSLNCQAICDAKLFFTDFVARWPGSCHDSTIFRESQIRDRFELGEFGDSMLLADQAYPLNRYILTPFREPSTLQERRFNDAHKKSRLSIERAFGVLKRIFPSLNLGLRIKLETAVNVIVACVVLYNFLRRRNMINDDFDEEFEENMDDVSEPNQHEAGGRGSARRILIMRSHF